MYYITYYYLNSLSITDCNVIKNIPRENIFQTPFPEWNLESATDTNNFCTLPKKLVAGQVSGGMRFT
jgi:hypothetical protein